MPSILTLIPVPPPANIIQYAEQLAQIETPDGVYEFYSNRDHGQVLIENPTRTMWWIQPDTEPILRTLQRLCPSLGAAPRIYNLRIVTHQGESYDADEELVNAFYTCVWNDYTCDRLAFTTDIRPGEPTYTHDDRCRCNACITRHIMT